MSALAAMAEGRAPWFSAEAPDRDVVLSTRVRLARNLAQERFPAAMPADELCTLRDGFLQSCSGIWDDLGARIWRMEDLDELERRFLVERHLVSVDFLEFVLGRGLVVSADESAAIMLNEEDHLRVQAFSAGLTPHLALARSLDLAQRVEGRTKLAFDEEFGYLTACPTNVGTGLRASLLLHLGGLQATGDLHRVLHGLRSLHYTVRGFYGEGTDALGALFQVSNSVTLGRTEEEILDELVRHSKQVLTCERRARGVLLQKDRARLEDRVWRAWALLRSCRLLSTREAFELLGDVRMGTSLKILDGLDESILNTLLITVQSAHQQLLAGRPLPTAERDAARATYVRGQLEMAHPGGGDR